MKLKVVLQAFFKFQKPMNITQLTRWYKRLALTYYILFEDFTLIATDSTVLVW